MGSAIEVRNLEYRYNSQGTPALSKTDIDVDKGDFLLITGRSGSGKSTLLKCMAGIIPHMYSGEMKGYVKIYSQDTKYTPTWVLSQTTGMVFQNPLSQLITSSVEKEIIFGMENLGIPRELIRTKVKRILDEFGMTNLKERHPYTLSGGEQQKLVLAATIAMNQRIILLDEPLSMLDSTSALELVEKLRKLNKKGVTVVVGEHRNGYFDGIAKEIKMGGSEKYGSELQAQPSQKTGKKLLDLEDIYVSLKRKQILEGISLNVREGEIVAVIGRNGSGKTTLFRAIMGLIKKDSGRIYLEEEDITEAPTHKIARNIGITFQNPNHQLFDSSVKKEVMFGAASSENYKHVLRLMGLERYEEESPLLLSEGEKKRVAIASSIVDGSKRGILLDEPTLGQDTEYKNILGSSLRWFSKKRFVLLSTHDLEFVKNFTTRFLLLDRGRIVAEGNSSDLLDEEKMLGKAGIAVPEFLKRSGS